MFEKTENKRKRGRGWPIFLRFGVRYANFPIIVSFKQVLQSLSFCLPPPPPAVDYSEHTDVACEEKLPGRHSSGNELYHCTWMRRCHKLNGWLKAAISSIISCWQNTYEVDNICLLSVHEWWANVTFKFGRTNKVELSIVGNGLFR